MDQAVAPPARRRLLLFGVPLALFLLMGVFLAIGLTRDPSTLPSALVGKPAPEFTLPPIEGRDGHGLSRADLGGQPMLVNVFASWCVPCRIEHPIIARLAGQGVTVQAINYKDRPEDAQAWLAELGDPYRHIGTDRSGRVGIDWGVYGVPETYVVDKDGRIAHRHVGPLQARDLERTILPLLERLKVIRLALILFLAAAGLALAATSPAEMLPDAALEARARGLGKELRCLVCQNQSIDDSDADLARDLRRVVRDRLVAGDSDAQVIAYVTERYGDFVLLKPPVKPSTWLLWFGPVVILLGGGLLLAAYFRGRGRETVPADDLDAAERERLRRVLADEAGPSRA